MKTLNNILFVISITIFLSLIYISGFNVFQTDDYIYAARTRDIGFLENCKEFYLNWGGRYFAYSLNTLIPAGNQNFNWLPKILPIFYISFLIFGLYLNFKQYFRQNNSKALQKSFILFLFYTVCLVNISEHYFWISGSNIYFLPIILSNFLIYFFGKRNANKIVKPFILFFIFILMGSNEFLAIYLLLMLCYNHYQNRSRENLLFVIVGILSFLLSFLAPGNFNRLSDNQGDVVVIYAKKMAVATANLGYIVLKIILILPLFVYVFENEICEVLKKISITKIKILLSFSLATLLFSGVLMLFVSGRTIETIMIYTFLLSSAVFYYYFKELKKFFWASLMIIFLPKMNMISYNKTQINLDYNLFLITKEVLFTPLSDYEKEVAIRHLKIKEDKREEVFVKPIKTKPEILYFEELGTKEKPNYINIQLKKFYNKKGVFLFK